MVNYQVPVYIVSPGMIFPIRSPSELERSFLFLGKPSPTKSRETHGQPVSAVWWNILISSIVQKGSSLAKSCWLRFFTSRLRCTRMLFHRLRQGIQLCPAYVRAKRYLRTWVFASSELLSVCTNSSRNLTLAGSPEASENVSVFGQNSQQPRRPLFPSAHPVSA